MTVRVVLDASAFDVIDTPKGAALRHLLRRVIERNGDVRCAAVTLADTCRGRTRTQKIEQAMAHDLGGQRVRVIATDERLAKLVGAILHASGKSRKALADAHVVAVCAGAETAIIVTGEPDRIATMAAALPGTNIVMRRPEII